MSWSDFFAMGGYAQFVWPSYGLVLAAMVVEAIRTLRRRRRLLDQLATTADGGDE